MKVTRKRKWGIAGIVLLAGLACHTERPADIPAPRSAVPVEGGRLVRRLESDVSTLNYVKHSTNPEKLVLSYIHDPLVGFDQNLEIIPGLAKSWTVSEDRLTWTFELEPAATFSDGKKVTATDVVFTLGKIVDPKSQSIQLAGMFEALDPKRTRAVDEDTVEVAFTEARPAQLLAFNMAVLPAHVYSRGNFATDHDQTAIGCGPYVFVRREPGREILLERREDYWRAPPPIHSILFRIIEDRNQAWNALRTGEIDETAVLTDQWLAATRDPSIAPGIEFHRFYELGYNFMPWNTRDPQLSDPRVRRALTMALDRGLLIEQLYYGTARITTGPFTPNHWAFNPAVRPIEFDPAGARRLIEEAGWSDSDSDGILDRDGKPFEIEMLLMAGDGGSANQAQLFQEELARVGVRLNINRIDPATLFSRVLAGEFQTTILAWSIDLDPDLFSLFHSSQFPPNGQNFVFYSNPEADRLIEEGRREFDESRRRDIYRELHRVLAEDQPYTWMVQVSTKWGVSERLRNVEQAEGFGLFGWEPGPLQWWIAPDTQRFERTQTQP